MKSNLTCDICGGGPYKNRDSLRRHKQKAHPGGAAGDTRPTPEPVAKKVPVGEALSLKKTARAAAPPPEKKEPVQEPLPGVGATKYYCVDCGTTVTKHQWQCPNCHRRLNWTAIGVQAE